MDLVGQLGGCGLGRAIERLWTWKGDWESEGLRRLKERGERRGNLASV